MKKLSPRLKQIYNHIDLNSEVWDLCCDHGYLGSHCLINGAEKVYFNDQSFDILRLLSSKLSRHRSLEGRYKIVEGPAEAISTPIEGTVVIAGVGGLNIIKILRVLTSKSSFNPQKIILSPMTHVQHLEEFIQELMDDKMYSIQKEKIFERGRERHLFVLS